MKRKGFISFSIIATTLVVASSIALASRLELRGTKADTVTHQLVLDSSSNFNFTNDPETIHIESETTAYGNDVNFIASGYTASEGFGKAKYDDNDGRDYFFANVDHIFGLKSITVIYACSKNTDRMYLEYSYTYTGEVQSGYIDSGVEYTFLTVGGKMPNYFKVYPTKSDADITSISLSYTCDGNIGTFPGYLTATVNGSEASITSHVYLSAGTRPFIIPNYYNEYPITSMSSSLFQNDYGINFLSFPTNAGFTTIPTSVCSGCYRLSRVMIPSNVTSIGNNAFSSCSNLNTIFFNGTPSQWNAISKGSNWCGYVTPTIIYI